MGTVNDFYADLGNGDLDEHDFQAQVEKLSFIQNNQFSVCSFVLVFKFIMSSLV